MKARNALLASAALVAMPGATFANGNISLSGSAETGIADGGGGAKFHMDADVTFTMASTADAGLTFGTAPRFDDCAGENKYAVHLGRAILLSAQ